MNDVAKHFGAHPVLMQDVPKILYVATAGNWSGPDGGYGVSDHPIRCKLSFGYGGGYNWVSTEKEYYHMNAVTIGFVDKFDGEECRFSSPNESEVWAWIRGIQIGMKLKQANML